LKSLMKVRVATIVVTLVVFGLMPVARATTATRVPPNPSEGCGGKAEPRGEERLAVESGGRVRSYYRFIPKGYDGKHPMPLVLDVHGTSEGATIHKNATKLGPYGDTHGFITLTPEGSSPPPQFDTHLDSADMQFLLDLLDEVEAELCIDTRREFVTGYSNGAMVTSVLACAFADRFAAFAPVAGVRNPPDCNPSRPTPIVTFHGIADEWLAYQGGLGPGPYTLTPPETQELIDIASPTESGLSVPDVVAAWAERNACDATPTEKSVASDVTLIAYDCPDGADVQLYAIEGAGHTWPGSKLMLGLEIFIGPTTTSISATALMWKFFKQHPLPDDR
jgi:polyhydroxybutyrate depolymerase